VYEGADPTIILQNNIIHDSEVNATLVRDGTGGVTWLNNGGNVFSGTNKTHGQTSSALAYIPDTTDIDDEEPGWDSTTYIPTTDGNLDGTGVADIDLEAGVDVYNRRRKMGASALCRGAVEVAYDESELTVTGTTLPLSVQSAVWGARTTDNQIADTTGEAISDKTGYSLASGQSVDMESIGGDADSLTRFKRSVDGIKTGSVVAGSNTVISFLTDLEVKSQNYYGDSSGGLVIVFIDETANEYQSRRIIASVTSNAKTLITVAANLDAIPSSGDEFVALGRISVE